MNYPQNDNGDGLSGPNSIMVVYMDPLGSEVFPDTAVAWVVVKMMVPFWVP